MVQVSENALPAVRVEEILSPWPLQNSSSEAVWLNTSSSDNPGNLQVWHSQSDLLNSGPFSQDFVVESQEDGSSTLRFGNGELGRKPGIHSCFQASYRVRVGDINDVIGPETLQHIVTDDKRIRGIRNSMDSFSFEAQETVQHARLNAPQLFKSQKRCITLADHIEEAEKFPDVKVATAQQAWTGSWETVFLYVQRYGGRPVNALFSKNLLEFLNPMRLAGRDIQIKAPHFVPLDIALDIQLMPQAPKMQIRNQLEIILSNRTTEGFFFPDHFTFGQTVYQSQIVAACANISGVSQVSVTRFCRYGRMHPTAAVVSEITIGALEMICLSNDPAHPELGKLSLTISGGVSL
jgi:predicted phage baseplate assembly protein